MTYREQPVECAATDSGFEDRGSEILKFFGSVVLFRGECNMYTNPCQQLRKFPTDMVSERYILPTFPTIFNPQCLHHHTLNSVSNLFKTKGN
jgi:hypothetical protein